MKKITKVFGAALISAAILATVSCSKKSKSKSPIEEAMTGIDVTDENEFTRFDPYHFRGSWIVGNWEYYMDINYPDKNKTNHMSMICDISIKPEKTPSRSDDYKTVVVPVYVSESGGMTETKNCSSSDFRRNLLDISYLNSLERELRRFPEEELKNADITGKPYYVINRDYSIIAYDFYMKYDGESISITILLKKKASKVEEKISEPAEETTAEKVHRLINAVNHDDAETVKIIDNELADAEISGKIDSSDPDIQRLRNLFAEDKEFASKYGALLNN